MKIKFAIYQHKKINGFSLVELILSVGIFVIFSFGALGYLLTSYRVTQKDEEYLKAEIYLQDGIDIVNFLKRDAWNSMSDGRYGLVYSGAKWNLVLNSNEVLESKYTRVVDIASVNRDTNGDIALSGGILDPYSKKITVSLLWKLPNNIDQNLNRVSYLTNWEKNVPTQSAGMMAYADFSGSDDVIKYKILNKDKTWSAEKTVPDYDVPDNQDTRRVELYASTTRNEYILLTKHTEAGQFMYANVWDGASWGHMVMLAGYGDNTNPNTRNFDGTYLSNGDFLVVYDDFTYVPKYRIWNGTSWSAQGHLSDLGFFGYPVWMQIKSKPNSNEALFVVRDASQRTTTFKWNGLSWVNKTTHGSSSSGFSIDNIFVTWSRYDNKYFGLMFNESSDSNPNLKIWNNSTSSWSSNVENVNTGATALIYELVDSPKSSAFLGCTKNSADDIYCMRTSLSSPSWSGSTRLSTRTNTTDVKSFGLGYESKTGTRALLVYADGATDTDQRIPKYRVYDESSKTWSSASNLPSLGSSSSYALSTVRVVPSPSTDNIIVMLGDNSKALTTVVWDGSTHSFSDISGYAFTKQCSNGSNADDFWYSFAWGLYEP